MRVFLGNAFSLNMLDMGAEGMRVDIQPVNPSDIPANAQSIIGHSDLAAILSIALDRKVIENRESVALSEGDILFVAQYRGPRLPVGTTHLPEDAGFEFYRIVIRRLL